MNQQFSIGDRVKISEQYHWAKNANGIINQPLEYILEASDGCWGIFREVNSLKGILRFYWVTFDESHFDADGDGPYFAGEIDSNYLTLLDKKEQNGDAFG